MFGEIEDNIDDFDLVQYYGNI